MEGQSVTRNTTYLTLSYIGQKLLAFVYFVLVARFIGVEDLGKYTFALSFTTLFAVFVDLGFSQALIREAAKFKERTNQYLSSVIAIKLIFSVIVYLVVVVLINSLGYPPVTRGLVYLSGLIMIIDQFTLSFWGVFRGWRNLKYESISIVINQIIIVAVGVVVLCLRLPLIYLMLPFICGSTFSLLFSAIAVRRVLKINFKIFLAREEIKFLMKIALPFALIAIFSRVYGNIDSIMLSKLIGDKAVGWYSVAMKIPFALQFIPAALAAAIFPAFSHHFMHDKEQLKLTFERVSRFLIIVALPVSFGIAVLAKPIILFFYGQAYLPAAICLQLLMLGLFFVFLNFPLGSLMNSCDRQVTNTKLVGITMLFNVILNVILIPKYSFSGAAIAFLISHLFLFTAGLIVSGRIIPFGKKDFFITFSKVLLSAFIMSAVIYALLDKIHFIALIFLGAIIYFACLVGLRGITRADWRYIFSFFHRAPRGEVEINGRGL